VLAVGVVVGLVQWLLGAAVIVAIPRRPAGCTQGSSRNPKTASCDHCWPPPHRKPYTEPRWGTSAVTLDARVATARLPMAAARTLTNCHSHNDKGSLEADRLKDTEVRLVARRVGAPACTDSTGG
jgi:hypothetical protein